jgi:hypothetical protein
LPRFVEAGKETRFEVALALLFLTRLDEFSRVGMSQISQMLDVEHPGIFAAYAPVRKTNTILRTPLGGTRDHLQYVLE